MRITRVHIDQVLTGRSEIQLPPTAAHHLLRVLRLRQGARLALFDGHGLEYPAEILSLERGDCRVRLEPPQQPAVESPLDTTLIQAISKGDRMDWCIQKATELGVSRIQPVFSERCDVRLDARRADKRLAHWQQVAIAAAEQSGRVRVPPLHPSLALAEISAPAGLGLYLDPAATATAASLAGTNARHFSIVVGPEGGLSGTEVDRLRRLGFRGLRLGPRVLRTETAGPAVLATLQTLAGDWQ